MGRTSDARQRLIESAMELFHSRSYADVEQQESGEIERIGWLDALSSPFYSSRHPRGSRIWGDQF